MEEQAQRDIVARLQDDETQKRIRQNIAKGRTEATVRIGWAAHLFDFSDSQLRDWENRGLLNPGRSKDTATGQRQYSLDELDKLAIIRELINAKFAPADIPTTILELWKAIDASSNREQAQIAEQERLPAHLHIDRRIELAHETLFYRFYVLHALRLSLMLIAEEIPDTDIGLILPLQSIACLPEKVEPEQLATLGESLLGWLSPDKAFYIFLDPAPSFEYPSDYQFQHLQLEEEKNVQDPTLIVLPRKAKVLLLSEPAVKTIRRLLAPLYEDARSTSEQGWRSYFAQSSRDIVYTVTDFSSATGPTDSILDHLADMVIRLGGKSLVNPGQNRWRFCCILLPNDTSIPMQQRRLIVRAQSKASPHTVGVTTITPDKPVISISMRAFQSGHTTLRSEISDEDASIFFRELEGSIQSAIAVPIEGESGLAIAVIYVVSDEPDSFPLHDQRLLRMLGRMVEELLLTYRTRSHVGNKLTSVISKPRVVDELFRDFYSENGFIYDLESLLRDIQLEMPARDTERGDRQISFISVDIDNQTSIASKYGDHVTRNLSHALGNRLNSQLRILFTRRSDWRFYHIYADRYYLNLDGTPLEQACEKAWQLQQALQGDYKVDALRITLDQATLPNNMLKLPDITVRMGVSSYEYWKLGELLQRYVNTAPIASVRGLIMRFLDIALDMGSQVGGNCIFAWNREKWHASRWSPGQK